jgi:signal transduction histidine kinase
MTGSFQRWPLARQLWVLLVTPTALALALYGFFAHQNRQRVLLDAASGELGNYASLVQAALAYGADPSQPGPMRKQMEALARADRVLGLAGYDDAGHALVVTSEITGASSELADIAKTALRRGADIEEARRLNAGPTLVRTVTLRPAGGAPYAIVIVLDLRYIAQLSASLDRGLVLTSAIVIAAIGLLTAWASRRMVGIPVGSIVNGADRVAAGELEARVTATGSREIAQLGESFNDMAARLEQARDDAEIHAEQRAAVERRLRHSQALAAAGQMAASVAHEIGSPLNVILGRARRGAEHAQCPEPIRRELDAIANQSERITRVVSGMLTLARPAHVAERGSNGLEVVDAVLAFLEPEARRRSVTIRVEDRAKAAALAMDRDSLFQVIFNLVMNGVQAQDGGEVVVRFGASSSDPSRATIEVEDHGPGVPAADAARIFDAFYTTKRDEGGTGLGLAIVAGILRDVGGAVELVPDTAPGALFRMSIPRRAAPTKEESHDV